MSKFGDELRRAIEARGYSSPTAFAREAGISPSAVTKWIRGIERPAPRTLEKVAPLLNRDVADLMALAYPGTGPVREIPEQPAAHPLATELGRMLADDSPVPAGDRAVLEQLVDHLVNPYRRFMRPRRRASGVA